MMSSTTPVNSFPSSSSDKPTPSLITELFQELEIKSNIYRATGEIKGLDAIYEKAADVIAASPERKQEVIQTLNNKLQLGGYAQVNQALLDVTLRREAEEDNDQIKLAPAVKVQCSIEDVVPTTTADAIIRECKQSGVRPIGSLMMLLGATGSLVGSRVQLISGKKNRTPVPPNLNVLITGDSSEDKSATGDPVADSMKALFDTEEEKLKEELRLIKKSNKDAADKKEAEQTLRSNRTDYYYPLTSFSPEAVTKLVCNQQPHAGVLIYRDEASGLFNYKRWGGNNSSSMAGDLADDEFIEMIMSGQAKAQDFRSSRVSDDKEKIARKQTLSVIGCLQNKYLSQMFDFGIDKKGWTARWLFVRASDDLEASLPSTRMEKTSPIGQYLSQVLSPFLTSIKEKAQDGTILPINLQFETDAQSLYDDQWEQIKNETKEMLDKGIEPAYAVFRRKGQLRILKFALLIHLLECSKGAHQQRVEATPDHPFAEYRYCLDRVKQDISYATLLKAIMLEQLVLKEYQAVTENAFASQFEVERAVEQSEQYSQRAAVLKALRREVSITEAALKPKIRSRSLPSSKISEHLAWLIQCGCISAEPSGRTRLLTYVKEMRD